ncbi:nucleotidyltransferase family protein [Lysinibacillus sp. CNPSo 3705]|uniref:nucleotidyltransferase family protein n=1 Tax=Lysinibacillus sp. CNPSo 3705 TaxID=3028148 RepID=UPI0023632B1D|nr:nucleotidyltransferase family protein [Lysinibacillus sp. CNPSo 3705]MDD1504958.1 nucleotidyltransferase family protein [Lysinibacillus sp. CNPSo 3705]
MDAIILAGGFGTRLQSVVSDVPKPMAPVANKPFLSYLLTYLGKYEINNVVLCTGYKHEVIENYFSTTYNTLNIKYSVENEPLGTGGAIKKALEIIDSDNVLILNGDTLFNINLNEFIEFHHTEKSDITIALKHLINFDRYGSVIFENNKITGFDEKMYKDSGFINGGVYLINKKLFNRYNLSKTFSFEKEILETKINELSISGYKASAYFIDIGIPEDYEKAQTEVKELFDEKSIILR